jgi:uncharacterized protein YunC (DUF1805 family)
MLNEVFLLVSFSGTTMKGSGIKTFQRMLAAPIQNFAENKEVLFYIS